MRTLISPLLYPLPLRAALVVTLWVAAGGGPRLSAQDEARFFGRREVNFWNAKRPAPASAPETLFPEAGKLPDPVRALLEKPTVENAEAYLAWQKDRARRLAAALAALQKAKEEPPEILLFTRDDCPYCAEQEKILRGIDARIARVRPGEKPELWSRHRVEAVPTVVVRGKVFRGLTPAAAVERELK